MQNSYCNVFSIAGINIALQTEKEIVITDSFKPFQIDSQRELRSDYTVTFEEVLELPQILGEYLYKEMCMSVVADGSGGYRRQFYDSKTDIPYGVGTYDWQNMQAKVMYIPCGKQFLTETGNCFYHTAWETMLLKENRLILHASLVETSYGGLLFTGPSGIGKSTQGDLWCRYEAARLLNGDRPILHKKDDIWMGYGSPYAGSSKCHVNASCPITAVVVLKQAKQCTTRRLNTSEGFCRVFSGLTVNGWDSACMKQACDLAEQIVCDIPVFELSCTPDRMAVETLKFTLSEEVR